MVQIHALDGIGPALLLFLMVLIWVVDSAAYFSGKRWGRVKLAPFISPGKTREGLYGALVGMVIFSLVLWYWGGMGRVGWFAILLLCMTTGLFSVVGDLFESLLKRQRGVKDSGHLLPGHGGVLDRIDSLTAASPIFLFGLMLLGAA
jgi:phosphatidate cytidylyltransferase